MPSNFKRQEMRIMYDMCMKLHADGKFAEKAPPGEMYGIAHKQFWNGWHRRGIVPTRASIAYAAYAAGVDAKFKS